jgi:hypothetical protein
MVRGFRRRKLKKFKVIECGTQSNERHSQCEPGDPTCPLEPHTRN